MEKKGQLAAALESLETNKHRIVNGLERTKRRGELLIKLGSWTDAIAVWHELLEVSRWCCVRILLCGWRLVVPSVGATALSLSLLSVSISSSPPGDFKLCRAAVCCVGLALFV